MRTKHAFLVMLAAVAGRTSASKPSDTVRWKPPTPTQTLDPHDRAHLQFSPRPTESPVVPKEGDLRRRGSSTSIGSNTCGFWTDDGSAMECDPAYTCTNIGQYRGCCVGSECKTSSFPSVCYGATEKQCQNPGERTTCCTDDINYPYCVTYLWATSATPNQVFTLFTCDSEDWAGAELLSPEPVVVTTTGVSSAPSELATVPANNGSGNSTNSSGNSTDSNGKSTNSSGGSSGAQVGVIVGGVVGGLAVIGAVVLGLVFMFLWYRKQQAVQQKVKRGSEDEAPPVSGLGSWAAPQVNGQGPSPMPVKGYDVPLAEMPQHFSTQGMYPTSMGSQYASLQRSDTLTRAEGADKLSRRGGDRRSELGEEQRNEMGEERRAELPT